MSPMVLHYEGSKGQYINTPYLHVSSKLSSDFLSCLFTITRLRMYLNVLGGGGVLPSSSGVI